MTWPAPTAARRIGRVSWLIACPNKERRRSILRREHIEQHLREDGVGSVVERQRDNPPLRLELVNNRHVDERVPASRNACSRRRTGLPHACPPSPNAGTLRRRAPV